MNTHKDKDCACLPCRVAAGAAQEEQTLKENADMAGMMRLASDTHALGVVLRAAFIVINLSPCIWEATKRALDLAEVSEAEDSFFGTVQTAYFEFRHQAINARMMANSPYDRETAGEGYSGMLLEAEARVTTERLRAENAERERDEALRELEAQRLRNSQDALNW